MNNKKLIAAIVLGIGAVISLAYGIFSPPKGRSSAARTAPIKESGISLPVTESHQAMSPIKRRAKRSSFTDWARSPFIPKGMKGPSYQMELSGILGSGKNLKAMINGEVVGKGDKIGSTTVVDILPDRVTLNDGSKDIVLRME